MDFHYCFEAMDADSRPLANADRNRHLYELVQAVFKHHPNVNKFTVNLLELDADSGQVARCREVVSFDYAGGALGSYATPSHAHLLEINPAFRNFGDEDPGPLTVIGDTLDNLPS